VAHWALAHGLRSGDAVALLMENRPEYVATWAGLAKVGVVAALINTNLTGAALRHALDAARTRTLVVGSECLDRVATVPADTPLAVWVAREPGDERSLPDDALDLAADLGCRSARNPHPGVRDELRTGDDLFYIYTSGTTGLPKAARFSHLRFLAMGELGAIGLQLGPDDVHYCALPLYHSAGGAMMVSSVLAAGATLALRRRFSARAFWDDCRRFGATSFQYIGEFCRYLLNQPERSDDRDHGVRIAIGNGLRAEVWEAFQKRFGIGKIVEFYGATEGNTVLVNLEGRVGYVGRIPFRFLSNARLVRFDVESESHVRDARSLCCECGPDEVGELVGRIPRDGDSLLGRFEGYTSKEETDRKILRDVFSTGDAWFRSGDLLRRDRQGWYSFVDRIGDTFRWKGENVSTQEVAETLAGYPGFEMVNVYGVSVPGHDGRAGMAAIVLGADRPDAFDGGAFYAFVDGALPRYAAPLFVRLVSEPEVTGTFKLRKVTLQKEGFDPERIADPLFVRDDEAGAYVRLGKETAEEIRSGARRI
jgi:fatty-acyl-CoA synthase